MKNRLRLMRFLFGLGGLMLIMAPGTAFAHDPLGGDELAVADWMLIAAVVTIVIAGLAGLWAYKAGQFSNIEESKYSMLETAEDFDQVMAEADERERAAKEAARLAEQKARAPKPAAVPEPTVASTQQQQAHVSQ
jgi:nitrogen fixation-related uncharacterized protein